MQRFVKLKSLQEMQRKIKKEVNNGQIERKN